MEKGILILYWDYDRIRWMLVPTVWQGRFPKTGAPFLGSPYSKVHNDLGSILGIPVVGNST